MKQSQAHGIRPTRPHSGFTLAELAIVLLIVSALLGGMMAMVSAQTDQRNWNDTQSRLEAARDAILGYAIANGRLPCPANSTSAGAEVRQASGTYQYSCGALGDNPTTNRHHYYGGIVSSVTYGLMPAVTVGYLPVDTQGFALDAWGNRIRYAVSQLTTPVLAANFTDKANLVNNYRTNVPIGGPVLPNDLIVCASATGIVAGPPGGCGASANKVTETTTVVAILYSPGKNGRTPITPARINEGANENQSGANDAVFISRIPDPEGASGGEFDDQVLWISVGTLYSKLIAAQILP